MRSDAILALYPTAIRDVDFVVADRSDGQGPQLIHWNASKLGPRPTAEQLAAAASAVIAADKADRDAFAQAVALLKQNYATMTPVQKALCVVLRRVVQEMRD
jgi:hypothetical protein